MPPSSNDTAPSLAFVSSNNVWGGSEELWHRTASMLAREGCRISVLKPQISRLDSQMTTLENLQCRVENLQGPRWIPRKAASAIGLLWPVSRKLINAHVRRVFGRDRPDLVVISQGLNYDGWYPAKLCRDLGTRYVLLSQKADDLYWPSDGFLDEVRAAHRLAAASFFVSRHNLLLTQEQLGEELLAAETVWNPFNGDWRAEQHWPSQDEGLRLACLARLDAREKGQAMLLRVLAMPKWRKRAISVSLFGSGQNAAGLERMAQFLGLQNVTFAGFSKDPRSIWQDHHGLILPSRCEGLPLSLIEAMLHHRVPIVTDVGGNAEVMIDGETGFVAPAPTEADLDRTLERAWEQRENWSAIGAAAGRHVRKFIPEDPVREFADRLLRLCREGS